MGSFWETMPDKSKASKFLWKQTMDPGFTLVLGACLNIWFVYMQLFFLDLFTY